VTVEEILVKFTGDASSLTNATDKAKVKTFGLGEQLLKLDKQMNKVFASANPDMAKAEELFRKMENAAKRLAMRLDELKKQESRSGGAGFLKAGAAGGIAAQLVSSLMNKIAVPAMDIGANALSQIESAISGKTSYRESQRIVEREEDNSQYLDSLRSRRIGDQQRAAQREMNLQVDPITGKPAYAKRLDIQKNSLISFEKQMAESQGTIARLQKEMNDNDTIWSRPKEQAYAEAEKALKFQVKYHRELEKAAHDAGEAIKDVEAAGGPIAVRMRDADRAILNAGRRKQAAGLTRKQLDDLRVEQEVEDTIRDQGDAGILLEEEDKLRKKLTEQYGKERETDEWVEKAALQNTIKRAKASAGFSGVEAEIIGRHALGEENGNAERLELSDIQSAAAIKDKVMTPFERGMKEKERIDRIRDQLDPETYQRAMAEIDKGMRGPGPAASRSATGYGSAEHSARMYAYGQVMTQPATQKANIDRLANEPGNTADKQTEANNYLRSIRDSIKGKKTVEVQPANLGGG
jgi:hypothetical protein